MAHVQITGSLGKRKIMIDGVDVTRAFLAEGFRVSDLDGLGQVHLHGTLVADVFEMDLPDAILEVSALPAEGGE